MKERKRGRRESAQDFRRILDHKRTVMVGDSAVDVRTARNARVQACGDRVGVSAETFADAPPDFVIGEMGSWWIECLVAGERQSFC